MFFQFTGRIPIHTGLQHLAIFPAKPEGLPLELPTIPEKLKEVGYDTHMIGKQTTFVTSCLTLYTITKQRCVLLFMLVIIYILLR